LLTKNLDADPDEANRTKTVKIHALRILVSLAIACGLLDAQQTRAAAGPAKFAFVFDGVGYLHRWSLDHQHEFTPEGQEESAWLKNNGAEKEKALIEWNDIPSPASFDRELAREEGLRNEANDRVLDGTI